MAQHRLKTWPQFFADILSGAKTFEIRLNDRPFNVGDTLILEEWIPATFPFQGGEYTKRKILKEVTYIFEGGEFGVSNEMVVMAIKTPAKSQSLQEDNDISETGLNPDINFLAREAHEIAKEKGFWPEAGRNVGELLMLTVSELGEAVEAHRKGNFSVCGSFTKAWQEAVEGMTTDFSADAQNQVFKECFEKHVKDKFEDELADTIIRVLDLCKQRGIDILWHIHMKMRYNRTRPMLNGKNY